MNKLNVLVFPGGSEIGLEIHKALSGCQQVRLFSAGTDVPNHAPWVFSHHSRLPSVHEQGWVGALNRVLDEYRIDYIYPAYDDVIVALAENATQIHAKLVLPDRETCRLTRSKRATYRRLSGLVPVPQVYTPPIADVRFPVFVKPDRGQGSAGAMLIADSRSLQCALAHGRDPIVMEYLPGNEVTVDCFSDREKGLLFCGARLRERTKAGISMAASQLSDPLFARYAEAIGENLGMRGAWFFQMKQAADGHYKLLEVAPRIAGAMAFHRAMGINLPLLGLLEQERMPLSLLINKGTIKMERALINRYRHDYRYGALYVDLDGTLLLDGRLNVDVIRLLFQTINENKPIKLLTRQGGDIAPILRKYRLEGLFDDVLQLGGNESKSGYIAESDAILIDDSFSERQEVHEALGIRTFDSTMLEVLYNERR